MNIVHVSAECYPIAKAGGLGDVIGALPRFLNQIGHNCKVIMPMYRTHFLYNHEWEVVHKGNTNLANWWFDYTVIKEITDVQGFELYLVDINGLLDREKVYGYDDDTERFCAFQISVLHWIAQWKELPDTIHVHDHHTALIPFMMMHAYAFKRLQPIPTVLTIHNAQYQGAFGWDKSNYLPQWDSWKRGLLEWQGNINPLASGIKCAWKVTTVSQTYMNELKFMSNGLESLFEFEKGKCSGIINGIDVDVWNPNSDKYLTEHFSISTFESGKSKNKKILCDIFSLDEDKPLFIFIGRLVHEKGADLLPQVLLDSFNHIGRKMNFLILGSGEPETESKLTMLKSYARGDYDVYIGYNETLSHQMYAGADFLLMPSRVEPCGLNQLYAMRYGTIPLVRRTGGLKDTVLDLDDKDGYGITFEHSSVGDITNAIYRAIELYHEKKVFRSLQKKTMQLDFSWNRSAEEYSTLYQSFQ
ncbi:MAG: glycogen synthase [bacterium]|jgi:starch synthase